MRQISACLVLLIFAGCASPLHKAARSGDAAAVHALLDAKAEVDARKNGQTPLHFAVLASKPEVVKLLVRGGADINAYAYGHCTPLHFAVVTGNTAMVQLLLENGANPEPGSAVGCGLPDTRASLTPLEMAQSRGNETMAALLRSALNTRLGVAAGSARNADEYGPLAAALLKSYQGGGATIAVAGFAYADGRTSSDGAVISDRFSTELINRKALRVVERRQIEKVLAELKLQNAGAINPESAKQVGRMLGADLLVIGGMVEMPDKVLELNIRLVSVESGEALSAVTGRVGKDWVAGKLP